MFEVIFKIWYLIAILPVLIFLDGNQMLKDFLKKRNIYPYWNIAHSFLLLVIIILIIFYLLGYR